MQTKVTVSQAMIDLCSRFTRFGASANRRKLMLGLARLAGSATAAATALSLMEASPGHASITEASYNRIAGQMTKWNGANGHTIRGDDVRPASNKKPLPAAMVIHENCGLNAHTLNIARRHAIEGFEVLAPDFLSSAGGTASASDDTAEARTEAEDTARTTNGALDKSPTLAGVVATLAFHTGLKSTTGKGGAVGFCWSCGMVNALAIAAGASFKAGVAYDDTVAADQTKVAAIKAAMLLHSAGRDTRINSGIDGHRAALRAAGVKFKFYIYDDASHAFNNGTSTERYKKMVADLARTRTTDWLRANVTRVTLQRQ